MRNRAAISGVVTNVEGLFRRLEDSHSLATVVIICILTALLGWKVFGRYEPVPKELDRTSVIMAAGMLQKYRAAEVPTAKPHAALRRSAGEPGYPLVLFALALADPAVDRAIACISTKQPCGPNASFGSLLVLQFALAVIAALAVFVLAFRLSASWEVAALTLIITFFASRFDDFAEAGNSLIWLSALTYIFVLLAVESQIRRNSLTALGTGLAGGTLAMFLPQAIVAILVVIMLPICLSLYRKKSTTSAIVNALFALAGLAATGSLVMLALSLSYDPAAVVRSMSQGISGRVGFHAMDFQTWLVSLIVPLPIVGDLADYLLPQTVTRPLALSVGTGTFALTGYQEIYPQTLAQPGTALDQLFWLVDTHVWEQAGGYLAATPTIFLRGIWGGTEFIGLFGIFHIKGMLALQRSNGRLDPLLYVLVPLGILLVCNTLLTANYVWTNTSLAFVYAYAIAYVIDTHRRPRR